MNKKKHTHGFKVPEDYFDSFEENLFSKIELENLPKDTGFAVPEDYFDAFDERLLQREEISEKQTKVRSLFTSKVKYAVAIAASITLLVLLFNKQESITLNANTVDYLAIENYINAGQLDYDVYDVSNLLSESNDDILDYDSETISEEEMESYLLDTVDESTLLNE